MTTTTPTAPMSVGEEPKQSWVPMIAIALGQAIMSYNVASLPVSMGGMVQSFGVPPTTVATSATSRWTITSPRSRPRAGRRRTR